MDFSRPARPLGAGAYHVWVDERGALQAEKDFAASPFFEPGDPVPEQFVASRQAWQAARDRARQALRSSVGAISEVS